MNSTSARLSLIGATLIATSCIVPYDKPTLTPRGTTVSVLEKDAPVPPACEPRGAVRATDGNNEPGELMYDGTRDRALIWLRNAAARRGANAVAITDDEFLVVVDGPGYRLYYVEAQALRCARPVESETTTDPTPR